MPKLTVQEAKEYGVLPVDSIITVQVADIADKEVPARNGREGWTKLEFKFTIQDMPDKLRNDENYSELLGTNIWGSVSMNLTQHPDNKLRQWAEALLNMGELGVGFELDTDMLIGRSARAVISQYDKRNGGKQHQVGALLPPGPVSAGPVSTPVAEPQQVQMATVGASTDAFGSNGFTDDPPF